MGDLHCLRELDARLAPLPSEIGGLPREIGALPREIGALPREIGGWIDESSGWRRDIGALLEQRGAFLAVECERPRDIGGPPREPGGSLGLGGVPSGAGGTSLAEGYAISAWESAFNRNRPAIQRHPSTFVVAAYAHLPEMYAKLSWYGVSIALGYANEARGYAILPWRDANIAKGAATRGEGHGNTCAMMYFSPVDISPVQSENSTPGEERWW
jgi:hypothetical protein